MIRAIVTDKQVANYFDIKEVATPQAQPWEAIVQVKAFSLNRGEILDAKKEEKPFTPGWDYAGIVISQAANGSGPKNGSRVVGLLHLGAWAEQVAAPVSLLTEIPDNVIFGEAATLPVAGLTALYALRKGGMLLGKRVLITGSTGGVGVFAHQLAALSGAYTIGVARNEQKAMLVKELGANEVIFTGAAISSPDQFGPYHLILDSVGGDLLASLLPQLSPQGTCVSFGHSSSPYSTIDIRGLGGKNLYSFFLGEAINHYSAAEDLALLSGLVAAGKLIPRIEVQESWEQIGDVAIKLLDRKFNGKAVLHIK